MLVSSRGVLVGEETTDSQLLVNKVGHGKLLVQEPRVELRGQDSAVTQERRRSKRRAGTLRRTLRLAGHPRVPRGPGPGAAHAGGRGKQ